MNKGTAKYYLFRLLIWRILIHVFLVLLNHFILKVILGKPLFLLFIGVITVVIDFMFFHICMKKMFFETYKHITIIPKFEKLTFGFSLKAYLKIFGTIMLIGISIGILIIFACIISGDFINTKYFHYSLYPISYFVELFVINRTVKRTAIIETKV